MAVDLSDEDIDAIQEVVIELLGALQNSGVACVVVMAGRGVDRCAYLDSTTPFAAQMLTNALKATQARNARVAN